LLIQQGVDVNRTKILAPEGWVSPLVYATTYKSEPLMNILLQNGADPSFKDERVDCLIIAIQKNNLESVSILLKYGAEVTQKHLEACEKLPNIQALLNEWTNTESLSYKPPIAVNKSSTQSCTHLPPNPLLQEEKGENLTNNGISSIDPPFRE
jgi:hypothetical protein